MQNLLEHKMKKVGATISIIGILLIRPMCAFGASQPTGGGAYHYEPEVSTLKGTLALETFPGPPEYSSIREGDRPQSFWVLKLDAPINVSPKNGNDEEGLYPVEKDVRVLQLVMDFDKVTPANLGLKKGAKFQITGTLSHRVTIHHISRVLIWVQSGNALE